MFVYLNKYFFGWKTSTFSLFILIHLSLKNHEFGFIHFEFDKWKNFTLDSDFCNE